MLYFFPGRIMFIPIMMVRFDLKYSDSECIFLLKSMVYIFSTCILSFQGLYKMFRLSPYLLKCLGCRDIRLMLFDA